MTQILTERLLLPLFHLAAGPVSLWQVLFLVAAGTGCWNARLLFRRLSRHTLLALCAILATGAGLRLALSPRNLLGTNYRGAEAIAGANLDCGFPRASSLNEVILTNSYYLGYGHQEYLRPFLRLLPGSPAGVAFAAGGLAACLHGLALFALALVLLEDERAALWCAGLEALCPSAIRLAFGDNVYTFGALPMLLGLFQAALYARTRSMLALAGALAAIQSAALTHAAFLPAAPAAALLAWACRPPGVQGAERRPWAGAMLAAFGILWASAAVVGTAPFRRLWIPEAAIGSGHYAGELLSFLFSRRNPMLDPEVTPALLPLLSAVGAAALARRRGTLLSAILGSLLLLEIPVVFVSGSRSAALLKHAHIVPVYLLLAGRGAVRLVDVMRGRLRGLAGCSLAALALASLAGRAGFLRREYNMQKEFSFLRRSLRRADIAGEMFLFGNGARLMEIIRPRRIAGNLVNEAPAREDGSAAPDDPRALSYLDCRLASGARPLAYLPLRCYYSPPSGPALSGLRPECARFQRRYKLEPVEAETFSSDSYCPETDRTGAREITIGFYRITGPSRPAKRPDTGFCGKLLAGAGADAPATDLSGRGALLQAVSRRIDQGRTAQAVSLASQLTRLFPKDPESQLALARAQWAARKAPDARRSLARALELSTEPRQRRDIALARQDMGDYAGALSLLRAALSQAPRDAELLRDLGVCEALSGRGDEAVSHLSAAIRTEPGLISAYLSLGSLHAAAGRRAQALRLYDRALAVDDPLEPALLGEVREARARLSTGTKSVQP